MFTSVVQLRSHFRKATSLWNGSLKFHSTSREKLTTSYVCGPGHVPLLGLTVGQLVQRASDLHGDRTALVFTAQNIRKTFHEALTDVDRVAAGLLSLGLERGDRIGIWGPNSYEWVLTQLAAARAGLVLVNINPAYRANELRYALNKVDVKALVLAEHFRHQNLVDILSELLPQEGHQASGDEVVQSCPPVPGLQQVIILSDKKRLRNALRWSDLMDRATPDLISRVHNLQRRIQFDDPVNIQFTSGTTGTPKAATLSHHNLVNHAYLIGLRMGYDEAGHKLCLPLPLSHIFASNGVIKGMTHGFAVVFPGPTYNGRDTVEAIQQESILYGAPTMFVDIINLPDLKKYDVSSLALGIMGGAPCPLEVVRGAETHLNMKCIMVGYGMTETSGGTFLTMKTDSLETRSSTVGRPVDHVEVKIVDPVSNEVVPINTPGEVLSRGYNTMLGYWNDAAATGEAITRDRWLRSGDIGVLDEYGYARIIGRIKEMIIRGGENIFPREIEEVLHTHPGVQEAHVIGVPDKRMGEELCACIRCKANVQITETELKTFCKERLSYFKVPRYWLFKPHFPMTVTGKVQKFAMRDLAVKELHLD